MTKDVGGGGSGTPKLRRRKHSNEVYGGCLLFGHLDDNSINIKIKLMKYMLLDTC